MIVLSGCVTEYEMCFDDCAEVECGYNGWLRASATKHMSDNCEGKGMTIKEYCYGECK